MRPERRACASLLRRCARSLASRRAGGRSRRRGRLAGVGDAVEAEHLDRLAGHAPRRRARRCSRASRGPCPSCAPATSASPTRSVPRWIEQRDDGAAARVELGLDDDAGRLGVGVGPQLLELGDDEDRVEQVVEALLRLGRDVDELGLAAPLRGLQAALRHLGAHARRVGALLVDLVDRDEDRHVGRLGVVDRLVGLRLHAVVGGDHDDRDVGDLGAAGAHGGERLVARRVEEGDRACRCGGPGRRRCAA